MAAWPPYFEERKKNIGINIYIRLWLILQDRLKVISFPDNSKNCLKFSLQPKSLELEYSKIPNCYLAKMLKLQTSELNMRIKIWKYYTIRYMLSDEKTFTKFDLNCTVIVKSELCAIHYIFLYSYTSYTACQEWILYYTLVTLHTHVSRVNTVLYTIPLYTSHSIFSRIPASHGIVGDIQTILSTDPFKLISEVRQLFKTVS